MSSKTKKIRTIHRILFMMSILLNIGPLAAYTIKALIESELVYQKVALFMTVFIVLILTAICIVNKTLMRSRLWIILIGIYICIDNIIVPLILIAICQILDELIINPLCKKYKMILEINKQIDARGA